MKAKDNNDIHMNDHTIKGQKKETHKEEEKVQNQRRQQSKAQ
jgi:hypothetical protein